MTEKAPGFALPPQQPAERPLAKPQYSSLKYSRRCYAVAPDGDVETFWLHGDGTRTRIVPWWNDREPSALILYLREKGYCTVDEAALRE